jgi:hypothetical protein
MMNRSIRLARSPPTIPVSWGIAGVGSLFAGVAGVAAAVTVVELAAELLRKRSAHPTL